MTNILKEFEKNQIDKLTDKKRIPAFRSGDTIRVTLKIIEGDKSRLQAFEGVCIARKNNSVNSKFTLRKISHGEGVERVFSLFSPNIDSIEVIRKGDVRRAKLYYLRDRTGKKARIADRDRGDELDQYEFVEEAPKEQTKSTENNQEAKTQSAEDPKAEETLTSDETKKEEVQTSELAKPAEESKAKDNQKAEDNSDESK